MNELRAHLRGDGRFRLLIARRISSNKNGSPWANASQLS